jgi:pimeloyl-ACP methyl ester carboxylesterase
MTAQRLRHGRVELALHELQTNRSNDLNHPPLLMLHALGGCTPSTVPSFVADSWSGPIFGLDFTGHGESTVPAGGGYSCEVLMGDADTALRRIGPAVVLGFGIGGYVGLLIAGAAPERVKAVIVASGAGLAGGGARPGSEVLLLPGTSGGAVDASASAPDPFALMELAIDVRPPNYIASFARHFVGAATSVEQPISICTAARPAWLAGIIEEYGVESRSLEESLQSYAHS